MYGFAEMQPPKAGLNDGYSIVKFFEIVQGNYGEQVYFEFSKGDDTVRQWYSAREDNPKSVSAFNVTMTQFLTGFFPPSEHARLKEAAGGGHRTLSAYITALKNQLPADYMERSCTLALTINGDGWSELPKAAFLNDGHIFWANDDFPAEITDRFEVEIEKAKSRTKGDGGGSQNVTPSTGASW